MLRLKDMHLMRVIFFSIAISSAIIFTGMALGIVDTSQLSVKGMTWGVIVGGMIFGLGWGVAGYCPCTSICALGEGRKDALYFIIGGLLGGLLFMLIFDYVKDTFLLESLWGGKTLLADMTPTGETAVISFAPAVITALVVSVVFSVIAYFLPSSDKPDSL